ncbi:MAG TPA: TIGR03435 family protein [Candidatus Acidoferrales bacterium]
MKMDRLRRLVRPGNTAFLALFLFAFTSLFPRHVIAQSNTVQASRFPQSSGQASSNADTPDASLPKFEVASVKKHPPENDGGRKIGISMGGPDVSQFHASNVTAKMLIATAYGVKEFQIAGGPSWIGSERWDINAKVEDSLVPQLQKLPREQQEAKQALMIRSLLLDRYGLKVTRSTKESNVLALVVAKGGPKLKEVPAPDPQAQAEAPSPEPRVPGHVPTPPPGNALMMMNGGTGLATLAANAVPITDLVTQLSRMVGQQVVDQTGLKGMYQYTLQFAPQGGLPGMPLPPPADATSDNNTASIFTALQEQLGMKLESTKGPVETITIDHIEEPSEN